MLTKPNPFQHCLPPPCIPFYLPACPCIPFYPSAAPAFFLTQSRRHCPHVSTASAGTSTCREAGPLRGARRRAALWGAGLSGAAWRQPAWVPRGACKQRCSGPPVGGGTACCPEVGALHGTLGRVLAGRFCGVLLGAATAGCLLVPPLWRRPRVPPAAGRWAALPSGGATQWRQKPTPWCLPPAEHPLAPMARPR